MHWAIWQQMKSPPKGFEEIVREHFRQRKTHVSAYLSELLRIASDLICEPDMPL